LQLAKLFDERWIPCSFRSQCGQDFAHQRSLCGLNAFLQEYNEILPRIACIRKRDGKKGGLHCGEDQRNF
jgi:hypothetical protein